MFYNSVNSTLFNDSVFFFKLVDACIMCSYNCVTFSFTKSNVWVSIYPSSYLFIVYRPVMLLNARDFYEKVREYFVVQYGGELTLTFNFAGFFFVTDSFISFSEVRRVPCFICVNEFVVLYLSFNMLPTQSRMGTKEIQWLCTSTQILKKRDDTNMYFHVKK